MRSRLKPLALLLLVLAAAGVTGCLDPTPDDRDYGDTWNTTEDVTYYLGEDTYTAVLAVPEGGENRTLRLWQRDPLGGDAAVTATAVKLRRDDEVENVSAERKEDHTAIPVGAEPAKVAYTGLKHSGEFGRPVPLNGSVALHLPEGTEARNLFIGRISPKGYEVVSENPLVVRWEEVDRGQHVSVDYYSRGHPWILLAALVVLAFVAAGVVYHYRNMIQDLRERRKTKERRYD